MREFERGQPDHGKAMCRITRPGDTPLRKIMIYLGCLKAYMNCLFLSVMVRPKQQGEETSGGECVRP
jgi:hypothetical protein